MASGEAEAGSKSEASRPAAGAESGRAVNAFNPEFIDQMYSEWKADSRSVSDDWNQFFLGFELGLDRTTANATEQTSAAADQSSDSTAGHLKQGRVDALIYQYRDFGHMAASLDPLERHRPFPDALTLEALKLSDAHLDKMFDPGTLPLPNPSPLSEIIELLEETYCRHIGVEYMHIQNRERRRWLQKRMEPIRNRRAFSTDQKLRLLQQLADADGFEAFLKKRYVGKKRFGLEGGESLIPLLDHIIQESPANGIREIAIGMAHRGRLNVLANVMKKSFDQIFTEFEESWTEDYLEGGGDVKYHRGYSNDRATISGENVKLTLAPNPSHLEFVTSVVLGRCRAKQRLKNDSEREEVIPVIIHGDSAFPGQGIVAECFNMMRLDGYNVGGTVHVVVNNQVGFTTEPKDAFSGHYCTDVAKMVDAPIFHVNGDDPEACAWVAQLALEYRQTFKNDVVIDMWCYRKNGHNEADEPSFTQPLMYRKIKEKTPVSRLYQNELLARKEVSETAFDERLQLLNSRLEEAQAASKENPVDPQVDPFKSIWSGLQSEYTFDPVDTTIDEKTLNFIGATIAATPEDFKPHKTVARGLKNRNVTFEEKTAEVDWGTAELLAYGSLLLEGNAVRLTGQDVERGTFSHRHSVLYDQITGESWTGLNEMSEDQAHICIHNTPLTECAIVGFEYGYSLADPKMLIIWEAQFGDFANGAQVIFDQFLASAELKWQRASGLTLFLPHGYEGQGPEHSSARLERFLSLCADQNMQVCYPSSASQVFHMLRRQMKQPFRKPLVVMTPKSMLRLPAARCTAGDITDGHFQTFIDDDSMDPGNVTELSFCSGKIFYDLHARRTEIGRKDLALVRMEQLYPIDLERLKQIIDKYPNAKTINWVQEEPENNGAWRFMQSMFKKYLAIDLEYIGRQESASPAVGSLTISNIEQATILDTAIGTESGDDDPTSEEPKEDETASEPDSAEMVADVEDALAESTDDAESIEMTEAEAEESELEQRSDSRVRGKNPPKTRRKKKAS